MVAGFVYKRRRVVRGSIEIPRGVLLAEPQSRIRPIPQLAGLILSATPTDTNANLAFINPEQSLVCIQSSKMPGTATEFPTLAWESESAEIPQGLPPGR